MPELVEICGDDYKRLRNKFTVHWPKHVAAYSLLNTISQRYEKVPEAEQELKLYSLDGDWERDGTFVSKFKSNVFFGSLDSSYRRLKKALKLLDYSKYTIFMCVPKFYYKMLDELIAELNLETRFDIPGKMVHMCKNEAKKMEIDIPPNFRISSLTMENVEFIKDVWEKGNVLDPDTAPYFIKHNISVGLFDETGELLAWCLTFDFGSLAALQVAENQTRKGYGEIVTRAIAKKIAIENNVDVTSNYIDGNIPSKNLVEKVGFEEIEANRWVGVVHI